MRAQSVQLDPVYKFPLANQLQPLKTSMSEAAFNQYHVFRAEARVVTADSGTTHGALAALSHANDAAVAKTADDANPTAAGTTETPPPSPTGTAPPAATATAETSATAPVPSHTAADTEITVGEANGVPEMPVPRDAGASDRGFTLHTTARLVDVGVVAFDKKGHPVTDLKPEPAERGRSVRGEGGDACGNRRCPRGCAGRKLRTHWFGDSSGVGSCSEALKDGCDGRKQCAGTKDDRSSRAGRCCGRIHTMRTPLVAVAVLVGASTLFGQSTAPAGNATPPIDLSSYQDLSAFTLKQEVRNVVVDVTVTDKHGDFVRGLDKSQFQIFENGVAQDIAFFEEHKADQTAPAQAVPLMPSGVHSNMITAPPGPLVVLLLDALNTRTTEQPYVRAQALDYLKQMPTGTRMAIFTLSDKLQLIQGFSSDPNILKAALDNRSYPQFVSLVAGSSTTTSSVRESLNRWSNGSTDLAGELKTDYTLDALNALSNYLSAIPGRKSLIWFAGSIPWTINPDFSLATSVTGRVDYSDALKQLANSMTVGRIAIYPVDAHALTVDVGYGADSAPTAGMGQHTSSPLGSTDNSGSPYGARGLGGSFGRNVLNGEMNLAVNHMSMTNLAAATGGRAFYNTNGLSEAVAKVHDLAESYYTVVYSPKDKVYDGGVRELAVKVSKPDVKLDYRRAYFAEDPAKTAKRAGMVYSSALRGVMQRGAPDATQIPFTIQAEMAPNQPNPTRASDRMGAEAATLKGPLVRYDFHWKVDPKMLSFSSTANGRHRVEVDATVAAYDVDGKVINNIYSTLPLNLNDAQYNEVLKIGLPMKQSLDIPAGTVYLRAGVVDSNSGHTGATEFPLLVSPPSAAVAQSSTARP